MTRKMRGKYTFVTSCGFTVRLLDESCVALAKKNDGTSAEYARNGDGTPPELILATRPKTAVNTIIARTGWSTAQNNAEHGLLVLDLDVPIRQEVEEFPEVPELSQAYPRESSRRFENQSNSPRQSAGIAAADGGGDESGRLSTGRTS